MSSKFKSKNREVGELRVSKDGKTKYLYVTSDVILDKDSEGKPVAKAFFFTDPKRKYEYMIGSEKTSEETKEYAKKKLENFPEYILARVEAKAD